MTSRALESMKSEWTRACEAGPLIVRKLHLRQVRLFLAAYIASFLLVLATMGPTLSILAAPLTLTFVVLVDMTVNYAGTHSPEIKNGPLELSVLVIVGFASTTLIVGLPSVIETPPYASVQVGIIFARRVAVFLTSVLLAFGILRAQGYARETAGLTSKSMASAWLVTMVFAVATAFVFPGRVAGITAGLPAHVAVAGLFIAVMIEVVFVAFSEELLVRGMIQDRFIAVTGSTKTGIILAALVFAFFHIPKHIFSEALTLWGFISVVPLCIVLYGPAGITFGIIFHRTRSLKWSTAVHAIINLANVDSLGFLLAALLL